MKDLAGRAGLSETLEIASAAVSAEELGNGVYPPVRALLDAQGIDCRGKTVRLLRAADYEDFDLLIGMDEWNLRAMRRLFGADAAGKLRLLLDFALQEIDCGCRALFEALSGGAGTLDLSGCREREALYAVLRRDMGLPDWSGSNLDALWDVLTGLPHEGERFAVALPRGDSPVYDYAARIREVFEEAGAM